MRAVCPSAPPQHPTIFLHHSRAGPIPLELLRWKFAEGRTVELKGNSGLELPADIGELGDSVTTIDLSDHNLRGAPRAVCSSAPAQTRIEKRIARAGPPLPETLQMLAPLAPTLEILYLCYNELGGSFWCWGIFSFACN